MKFNNKVVLITGGSSGIGLAVAEYMAKEGAIIVIASRSEEKGHIALKRLHAIKSDAIFISIDVTQPSQIEDMVKQTVETFGRLDFAFNFATNLQIESSPSSHEETV